MSKDLMEILTWFAHNPIAGIAGLAIMLGFIAIAIKAMVQEWKGTVALGAIISLLAWILK